MISQEYISDSEDESDMILHRSMVSPSRLAHILRNLPPSQRQAVSSVAAPLGSNVNEVPSVRPNEAAHEIENAEVEQELVTDNNELQEIPQQENELQEDENNNNLRIYLDSRNFEPVASRRGLRKRNFASTHPYLADQAHYLGLSSINYLNELYDNEQDFESIVKYLNFSYKKMKESNPKDEKYKAKNFYAILGKQSAIAQANEIESRDDNNDFHQENNSQSQTQNIELEEENSSYESDDSLVYANVPDKPFDMPEANDSSGEETDHKRLSKKDHQLNYRQLQRKKKSEPRRGLAIKKTSTTPKLNRRKDVFDFVDDANDFDGDNQFYRRFDTSHEAMSDFDTPLKGVDTFGILSDSSSETDTGMPQGYHSDVLFARSSESPKPPTWDNELQVSHSTHIESDSSVEEIDSINPMFANRKTQKRKANITGEKRQKQSSKITHSSSALANRSFSTPSRFSRGSTSKLSRRSEGTPRPDSRAPKSNVTPIGFEPNSDNEAVSISKVLERNYPIPIKSLSKPRRNDSSMARGTLLKKPFRSSKKTQKPQKVSNSNNRSLEPKTKVVPGKNAKELLKDNYQFSRSPVAYTTAFEAESEKVFVRDRSPKHPAIIRLDETTFPNEYILRLFDLKRISQINEGKTYILPFDIAHVVFMGESFSLNLFDKSQSIKNCERILFLFIKELRNLQIMPFQRIELELYSVIKCLLRWFLIVQEPPSERTWKLLNRSVTDLLQNNTSPELGQKSLMIYPWIVLIFFVLDVMVKKTEQSKEFSQLNSVASQYWRLFFQWFDIHCEIPPNSKQRESFLIMCQVLNLQRNWWGSISNAIDELSGSIESELIMEKLCFLVMSVPREQIVDPSKRWEPFYKLYSHFARNTNSDSHVRFYDIVMNISHTYHWKVEEPMLFMFYNTITSRKFENFEDEWAVPQILGRIRTRSDIPIETFFDKFIYLTYNFISDLPTDGNKKKLITKLITSSHYNYQKDKQHFVMFLNRLNLILFLSQLSNIDLKNQLHDLIQRVRNCKDSEIFAAVCEGLWEYVEITITKNRNLPIACFKMLMDGLIEDHVSIGSVQKIWDSIFKIFQRVVSHYVDSRYLVQFLEIYNVISESLTDKLSLELHRLLSKALSILGSKKYFDIGSDKTLMKPGLEKTLNSTQDKIYSLLHKTMSRLPLPNITEENKLDPLIELYFQLWMKVASLIPSTNWNKLVLQIFPYIGNSVSREKFKLYFYLQLSLFTSYEPFIDDVLIGIFRTLACYSPSKYQAQLMNQLNKEKDEIILFRKQYVPDELTPLFISNFRAQLVQNMFFNLSKSFKPTVTKSIYIEEFLKTLNEEFDKYFSSTWYKEFCTVCIKTIQKHCGDLVSKNALLRELASKLSIPQYELDKYNWCLLPLTDRLHSLNKEIVNAIYFGKDAIPILRTYTFDDGVELIYHLVSIYSRAIGMNQSGRWKYNYYLLDFFVENLKLFKFQIFNGSFRRFLNMLVGIFHLEVGTSANKTDKLYRTKILILIVKIIQFACLLCEGYQDFEEMDNFRLALLDETRTDEPVTYYSSFRLFDIQDVRDDNAGIALNEEFDDETVAAEELNLSKLMESINTARRPIATGTIDLDLEV